jgi:hypothetical protein
MIIRIMLPTITVAENMKLTTEFGSCMSTANLSTLHSMYALLQAAWQDSLVLISELKRLTIWPTLDVPKNESEVLT